MISRLRGVLLLCWLGLTVFSTHAQTLPPCTERSHWTFDIRARPELYCVEIVLDDMSAGEMGFTGLAFAPDGRLFAARPLYGQVLMLRDTDGDTQPDSPQVIADGLDRPNALLYRDETLYITGGSRVYRLPDGGDIEVMTDALPTPSGLWNGGLSADDEWLYIGTGAPCETCDADPRQGAIVRLPLVGGEMEVYAHGFRQPLGLLWHEDTLWATDSTSPVWQTTPKTSDELNRVTQGAEYGYPGCLSLTPAPASESVTSDSCETTAPVIKLPTLSQPNTLTIYKGEAFPHLQGKLLITLMGSTNRSDVRGYSLIAFDFPPPERPFYIEAIIPFDASITSGEDLKYSATRGIVSIIDMSFLNRRGVGVWPHHLYGLAVSPEGWIYMSLGGGRILSLRPR